MKTLTAATALLGVWLTLASQTSEGRVYVADVEPSRAVFDDVLSPGGLGLGAADLVGVVDQYCVRCHNERRLTGNLTLDGYDPASAHENAAVAEKMIVKLRAGMMPPPGANRPEGDTLLALVERLEAVVDGAAAANPNPGSRRFQRLNRAEYGRVVRELLGLEIDAGRWLPADTYLGNFDNLSDAQGLSTTLLEAYLRAATEVSRIAVGNPEAVSTSTKYMNPIEVSQHAWDHLLQLEHNGQTGPPLRTEPIFVRAGQRRIATAFVRHIDGPYEDRLSPFEWSFVGGEDATQWANYGITALPHLADLMVTGPETPSGVSPTPSREALFSCYPDTSEDERPCAEAIVHKVAQAAYRRPVTEDDIAGPMSFYDRGAAEAGFEIGVRTALQAILANPAFIFRLEEPPAGVGENENYRISDVDLASRLSFFLWATGPDEGLLTLAEQGRLSDPAVLEGEVRRMLADPRSEALSVRFASQWLRLQDAKKNNPELYLYPDFTGQLGDDMVSETQLFFDHLIREDRSLLQVLDADYTFLNARLAEHYGIPGITGDEFRRVSYPDKTRRGLLGHGSVLLLTSMSARTSPVLRGKWVMEVLMGTPPPPPPPNVPNFEETEGAASGRRLTTRERMEIHRANPTCNSCHRFMDPIGLALDNFDVTGQWRIRENQVALDTRGTFYDGTPVSTPADLTTVLLKRPIPIVRNFTTNLLAYAIGRRAEYYDQPSVRQITADAEANDYRMSSFIIGVVQSDPFQMMRSQPAADAGADDGALQGAHEGM